MSGADVVRAGRDRDLRRLRAGLAGAGARYATLVGFVAMVAIFSAQFPDTFGTWDNLKATLQLAAPLLVLAVGLTVVLIVGEFDLSFPGVITIAALGAVKVMADGGASATVGVIVGLTIGLGAGLVAGLLVVTERASSFIITLALNTVWAGVAIGVSDGKFISEVTEGYRSISLGGALVPTPVWIALGVTLLAFGLVRWTVFGRQAQAVGSNASAARLSGVRVKATRVGAFAFLGVCAGLAAVMLSASSGFTPDLGTNLFIPPFVAAFFGISVLAVGRFNVFGTVVGALFIQTLQTGLTFHGVSAWVSNVVIGGTLLGILLVAGQLRRK